MRVKFTIAICALLVLGLAVSEVAAQGYRLSARVNTVVASGNNQELGALRLTYKASGNVHIPSNNTIEITFGGLTITSLAGGGLVAGDRQHAYRRYGGGRKYRRRQQESENHSRYLGGHSG